MITGNSGNNTLNGGLGADTLIGGTGNDTYIIDNVVDVIIENSGEGTDAVQSSVSWTLIPTLENLILTGTDNIDGTGNDQNNTITGNGANNVLSGGAGNDTLTGNAGNDTLDGGLGVDQLIGGAGNDTYFVDNVGDIITESSNAGIDTVNASLSWTLGSNLENLTLTGTGNINGTGNTLANLITGNDGSNTLSGGSGNDSLIGGAGNDVLIGGLGKDILTGGVGANTFTFTALGDSLLASFDVLTDLKIGTDIINGPNSNPVNAIFRGAVNTLDQVGISAVLTSANFGANGAATFTFGSRTFMALNNGTAGFSFSSDAIIEITGYSGDLNNLSIS